LFSTVHAYTNSQSLTEQEGAMLSVATWYDNEMGYATRLAETAAWIAR